MAPDSTALESQVSIVFELACLHCIGAWILNLHSLFLLGRDIDEAACINRFQLVIYLSLLLIDSELILHGDFNFLMQGLKFLDLLLKELLVLNVINLEDYFVPFLTNPTLDSIDPVLALLDIVMAKNTRENDLLHVASHRIFLKEVLSDLVDTHEH